MKKKVSLCSSFSLQRVCSGVLATAASPPGSFGGECGLLGALQRGKAGRFRVHELHALIQGGG